MLHFAFILKGRYFIMFSQNENAIKNIKNEQCWINPYKLPFDMVRGITELVVSDDDIKDAEARLLRFAPFIKKAFPETEETNGIIESPLREIPLMQKALKEEYQNEVPGRLFLKMDSHLAVAGSVKARGGIYEVLKHAEDLALAKGNCFCYSIPIKYAGGIYMLKRILSLMLASISSNLPSDSILASTSDFL